MYTAHTNPHTCAIESDCPSLHNLTNCDPSDPSSLMIVLETEGYTNIEYLGNGYFTFNSLTSTSQHATLITYTPHKNTMRTKAFYLTPQTLTIPSRSQRAFVKRLNAIMVHDYSFTTKGVKLGFAPEDDFFADMPSFQDYLDTMDDSCYA